MDTTNATWPCKPVSAKGKASTFALCLIPSLSICYKHHSGPGWPGSGLFGCPHTLQLACQPTHLQADRASLQNKTYRWTCAGVTSPFPRATLSSFKWQQGEPMLAAPVTRLGDSRQRGLDPEPVKSELRWVFVRQRNSMFLNKTASTHSCMTCR